MKAMFGQYSKVVILLLAIISLVLFVFSTGANSFAGQMQVTKPEASYGKEDNEILMDDIAARKKPVITVTKNKLKRAQSYTFLNFASVKFEDNSATGQKIYVKQIEKPDGSFITDQTTLSNPIKVSRGTYTVTYRAEETYKGAFKFVDHVAKFVVD